MLQTAQKSASEQHRRLPKRKHGAHPRFFKRGVAAARKWARFCAQKLGRSLPRRPKKHYKFKEKWARFRAQKMGRISRPENGQVFAPRKWAGFRAQKMGRISRPENGRVCCFYYVKAKKRRGMMGRISRPENGQDFPPRIPRQECPPENGHDFLPRIWA